MRTLLCLRFKNAASAQNGWAKLLPLVHATAHVTGPWFVGRGLRPLESFPGADTTHTTFRHEGSIAGYAIFAILGLALAGYYGDHSAPLSGLTTYGLGFVAFGVCGWLLGALFGSMLPRQRLARAAALLSQDEIIMIVGCKSSEKETIKTLSRRCYTSWAESALTSTATSCHICAGPKRDRSAAPGRATGERKAW